MIDQDYYIQGVYLDDSKKLFFNWTKGLPQAEVFVLPANVKPKDEQEMADAIGEMAPFAVLSADTPPPLSLNGIPANVNLLVIPSVPSENGELRRLMQCNGKNVLLSFDGMRTQVTFSVKENAEATEATGISKLLKRKDKTPARILSCDLYVQSPEPLEKGAIVLQVGDVLVPLPAVDSILRLARLPFTGKRQVQPRFYREEDQHKYELCVGAIPSSQ